MNSDADNEATGYPDKSSKIFAHVIYHIGAVIRLVIIGFGCFTLAHMLTGVFEGARYWIGGLVVAAIYLLGAIMEYAGEYSLKKDKKP